MFYSLHIARACEILLQIETHILDTLTHTHTLVCKHSHFSWLSSLTPVLKITSRCSAVAEHKKLNTAPCWTKNRTATCFWARLCVATFTRVWPGEDRSVFACTSVNRENICCCFFLCLSFFYLFIVLNLSRPWNLSYYIVNISNPSIHLWLLFTLMSKSAPFSLCQELYYFVTTPQIVLEMQRAHEIPRCTSKVI